MRENSTQHGEQLSATTEHNGEPESQFPIYESYDAALARLQELDVYGRELDDRIEEALAGHSALDEAQQELYEINPEMPAHERLAASAELIPAIVDDDTYQRVKGPLAELVANSQKVADAREQMEAHAEVELAECRQRLIDDIDWHRAFSSTHFGTMAEEMDIFSMRYLLSEAGIGPGEAAGYLVVARQAWAELHRLGLTRKDEDAEKVAARAHFNAESLQLHPELQDTDNLQEMLHEFSALNAVALKYVSEERQKVLEKVANATHASARNLRYASDVFGMNRDQSDLHPVLKQALREQVAASFAIFDTFDAHYINISTENSESFTVQNGELCTESLGIDDPETLLYLAVHGQYGFPRQFTRGLEVITFEELKEYGPTKHRRKIRGYVRQSDSHTIHLNPMPLLATDRQAHYREAQDIQKARAAIKRAAYGEMLDVVYHELTHYAHLNTIPVSWLRGWERIVRKEHVLVSSYARNMREEGHRHAPMEDLADAAAYYRRAPVYMLQKGAKDRFRHINTLFGAYDPQKVEKTIKYFESGLKPGDPDYDFIEQGKKALAILH